MPRSERRRRRLGTILHVVKDSAPIILKDITTSGCPPDLLFAVVSTKGCVCVCVPLQGYGEHTSTDELEERELQEEPDQSGQVR